MLSPDNESDHWAIIEGQGSLIHPSYAGVTLGLMHGSQPDALVLCHDANRELIQGVGGDFPIPPIDECIELALSAARVTNPECVCAGISINTSGLHEKDRADYLADLHRQHSLPVVDPVATGIAPVADFLLERLV